MYQDMNQLLCAFVKRVGSTIVSRVTLYVNSEAADLLVVCA